MTGFQSLIVGISGLQAQSKVIGAISDNLSNVSTVGYKKSAVLFQNLLGNDVVSAYTPGGAGGFIRHLNNSQGIISSTTSPTDIAISGTGFFAVRRTADATGDLFYTRAGAFSQDLNGDFVNTAGYYLQGWLLQDQQLSSGLDDALVSSSTAIAALTTVNAATLTDVSVPTTLVSVRANLTASKPNYAGTPAYDPTDITANMSNAGVPPTLTRPLTIVDSLGTEHDLTIGFLKTGANAWAVEIYANDATELGVASAQLSYGTVTFNGDGSLASVTGGITGAVSASWALPDPATNSFTVNWGTVDDLDGLSQLDAPFQSSIEQNGFTAGSLRGVTVTSEGYVVGNYDDGKSRRLYKIPLAIFTEQNQLENLTGNIFSETTRTGDVNFVHAATGGFGTIYSSALESSNVDTADEMANMIVAQRSYEFNSRIISTADNMLETVKEMLG